MTRPQHEQWVLEVMLMATPPVPAGFYGSVTLNFQGGALTTANVAYTVKPAQGEVVYARSVRPLPVRTGYIAAS